MKVEIAGKEIDLAALMPMRAGDFRRMERAGATVQDLENGKYEAAYQLTLAVLRRADEKITEIQLDDVPVALIGSIGKFLRDSTVKENQDRPTSASPTSSSMPTGGASPS